MNEPASQPEIKPGDELAAKLEKFAPAYRVRLTSLYNKWLEGKAKKDDIYELEKAGLIAKELSSTDGGVLGGGLPGVSNWIQSTYPGVIASKRSLSNWLRGIGLPDGCSEPFPPAVNERYEKTRTATWVEKHLVTRSGAGKSASAMSAVERKQEAEAKLLEKEVEKVERKESREWMLTTAVKFTAEAAGIVTKKTVSNAIEKTAKEAVASALASVIKDETLLALALSSAAEVYPAVFDSWQHDYSITLRELMKTGEKISEEKKESLK